MNEFKSQLHGHVGLSPENGRIDGFFSARTKQDEESVLVAAMDQRGMLMLREMADAGWERGEFDEAGRFWFRRPYCESPFSPSPSRAKPSLSPRNLAEVERELHEVNEALRCERGGQVKDETSGARDALLTRQHKLHVERACAETRERFAGVEP